ncbi:MAG: MlaE family lipid ABC transporter permease subunit [Syntrophobacteraceae bacterium]
MTGTLPFEAEMSSEGKFVLAFKTPLTYEHAAAIWQDLSDFLREKHPLSIVCDLAGSTRIDSAGVALLRSIQRVCERRGTGLRFESIPPSARHFLAYIEKQEPPKQHRPPLTPRFLISKIGRLVLGFYDEITGFGRFCADFAATAAGCLYRFRRFRWGEMFYYLQLSGANAMSILFLVSFLLGVVMAFQAAVQLRQFGANIFVADLLSLSLARELAPIFTAIILAGRSASAYAAEIGTMKVGEELDALAVMGFNLTEFITVPKVFALMIASPLLTMWSNFAGIIGGIVVGIATLDLTAYGFMAEIYTVLTVHDLLTGLIKAEFFAILIALIGCFRGFETGKGADSVGRQTTSAVVSGLFLIIFADAIFTIVFYELGW